MTIVAKKWAACACLVAAGTTFVACSSSNAGGPNFVDGGVSDDAGVAIDTGTVVREDSAPPLGDDASDDDASPPAADAGGDAAPVVTPDAGTDAAPPAADAGPDSAAPLVQWFCLYSGSAPQPFCHVAQNVPGVVCGTQSGTDGNVDAGVPQCDMFGHGFATEPCVVNATTRPVCSYFVVDDPQDGGGNWYSGMLTKQCTTAADCTVFGSPCETTGLTAGYCG